MNTTSLNANPDMGAGERSEKREKVGKRAAKAALFAGSAGLGVAGTMAANAMDMNGEDSIEEDTANPETAIDENTSVDLQAESATDFNPNDIVIDADEIVVDDAKVEPVDTSHETNNEDIAVIEPQPITGGEVLIAEVDPADNPYMDIEPDMYGGPDGWEDFDHDEDLLADNDDINDDIDIADDILA